MSQPTLDSDRLLLRPFLLTDAATVQSLAGDHAIADTTLSIPHPYEDGMAEQWIAGHESQFESGTLATFAITLRGTGDLVGAIGLTIDRDFDKAELGYWIGKPYWNQGFATEAAGMIVEYGFNQLNLNRISAKHLARNPSSGRVMEKIGMVREGTARQATMKWGRYEDLHLYGLLRQEWAGY